nr:meiotic nuclear division protein 1 homolog isoform X1 [Rattus norvegicus]
MYTVTSAVAFLTFLVKEKRTEWGGEEDPDDGNIFRDKRCIPTERPGEACSQGERHQRLLNIASVNVSSPAAMSVKEVLQSLVDDGMVDCERIGTSNYYWAFPSKALHARKRKLEALNSQLSEGSQKHADLQKSIEKARVGRQETEERAMLAKELSSFQDQRKKLKAEVEKYRECDPQVVEEIRQANKVAKEAANRWTDNIFAIKSWAKRKYGFEETKIDKNFGIPEDFDYVD